MYPFQLRILRKKEHYCEYDSDGGQPYKMVRTVDVLQYDARASSGNIMAIKNPVWKDVPIVEENTNG